MRIRALKPEFFKNEELCDLSTYHRLCYAGLWCCADRDGRLRDRPKRLKADIFPYDDLNMDLLLWDLARAGFIRRYAVDGQPLIDIPKWTRHQRPRPDEAESELSAYVAGTDRRSSVLDETTYPASRPIDTFPSLSSDDSDTAARIGKGIWDLGSGNGKGIRADEAALPASRAEFRAQDLMDLWNTTTKPPIPRCRELTNDRRGKIRSRIAKRPSLSEWREAFEAIQAGAFYRGENDRGWTADFDWVIKNDTVIAKVLERSRVKREPRESVFTWNCPHVESCSNRAQCENATLLNRPRKSA